MIAMIFSIEHIAQRILWKVYMCTCICTKHYFKKIIMLQYCLQNMLDPRVILSEEAFGTSTGPTYTMNPALSCSGLETSLADCDEIIINTDIGLCTSEAIVGLLCEGQFEERNSNIQR